MTLHHATMPAGSTGPRASVHPGDVMGEATTATHQDLDELVRAFTDPGFHVHEPDEVTVLETHVSVLFFAGPRVYKLKKAVDLGFLDHRSLEVRRKVCADEVRLNERLAPGVYRAVIPVTRESDGTLCLDGDGDVVEAVVEMERLPEEGMLDRLLDEGAIDNEVVHQLAELLAMFHQDAPTGEGVDEHGTPEAVRRLVLGNVDELLPFTGDPAAGDAVLPPAVHAFLRARLAAFLDTHERLLARRVADGRIRDGHGDLHAGNLCRTADGWVAYDRIEFCRAFRCADTAADLAFLAMDLDARGFRAFSRHLVQRYQALQGDRELGYLVDFYKTHRALVRAKVAAIRARQLGTDTPEGDAARREAMASVHLAASYQLPPVLLLTCGLPGSGKSWLARRAARPFEARVVRSDVVRKQLAGLPPTQRPAAEEAERLYSKEVSDALYGELAHRALGALARGRSVVVDAMFSLERQRRRVFDAARRLSYPVVLLHVRCDEETVAARMKARAHDPTEVSDADMDVYRKVAGAFEPPREVHETLLLEYDSGSDVDVLLSRLVTRLVAQAGDDAPARAPEPSP